MVQNLDYMLPYLLWLNKTIMEIKGKQITFAVPTLETHNACPTTLSPTDPADLTRQTLTIADSNSLTNWGKPSLIITVPSSLIDPKPD